MSLSIRCICGSSGRYASNDGRASDQSVGRTCYSHHICMVSRQYAEADGILATGRMKNAAGNTDIRMAFRRYEFACDSDGAPCCWTFCRTTCRC